MEINNVNDQGAAWGAAFRSKPISRPYPLKVYDLHMRNFDIVIWIGALSMNRILIIDDDKELCTLIKQSVLQENIDADFCCSGKSGLLQLKENDGKSYVFGL